MKINLFLAFLITAFISSCNKTEDVIIRDNVPPPDHTIDSTTLEVYIDKVYIHLLGRETNDLEKSSARTILKQHNFSVDDRKQFLENVFAQDEYKLNLYTIANHEYLNDLDSLELEQQIVLFTYFLTQPQYAPFYDILTGEIARMETLRSTRQDLKAGTADYREMLKRITNNYFYDQINMGTENFVISTFQNYLFRYPSDAELLSGKTMVDGNNAIVFLEIGKSKTDYINIFFDSDDYYEGQVRNTFTKYLFREPNSAEMGYYSDLYKSGTYLMLQKEVLSLDEYAGVE